MDNTLKTLVEKLPGLLPFIAEAHYFPTLSSTNDEMMRLGKADGKHGTAIVADHQTAGRGRIERLWESPAGKGLYFSLLLRPPLMASAAPLITLATGLALGRALRSLGLESLIVKWPNDIWVGQKKLAGILTEMVNHGRQVDFVVVGVGLNVFQRPEDFSPSVRAVATSLKMASDQAWDRGQVLLQILMEIFSEIEKLIAEGPGPLIARWTQTSGMVGKKVQAVENDRSTEGVVCGLSPEGQLQVKTDRGENISIIAGDVFLL